MGHIHTKAGQHDFAVSLYIVNLAQPEEPRALLHEHKVLGVLMQPGGHVELDEHPWASVKHELLEETGYELDQLAVLQPPLRLSDDTMLVHPVPLLFNSGPFRPRPGHNHTNLTYAFVTDQQPRNAVAEGESDTLAWLSTDELAALPQERLFPGVPAIYQQLLTSWANFEQVPAVDYIA